MENKDLEYLKNLKYDVILRKNKGKFTLFIHQLCLFVEDENLEKAYEKLEYEKEKYFSQIIEYNYQDHIVEPKGSKVQERNFWNLVPFFVKLIVITTVVVILLARIDDISSTFKHLKRAAKTFVKTNQSLEHLTETVTTGALKTIDKHQIIRERDRIIKERARKWAREQAEYTPENPVEFSIDDSLDGHPVEYAFDSDPVTFWHSTMSPVNLDIKFKQPTKLGAFSISSRHDIPGTQGPDAITIEGSNDNKAWEHYGQVSELTWKTGETKNLIIEGNNKTYTYYRFKLAGTLRYNILSISEMKLYIKKTVDVED